MPRLKLIVLLVIGMSLSAGQARAQTPTIAECIATCDVALEAREAQIEALEEVVEEVETLALAEAKEVDRLSAPIRDPSVLILIGGVLGLAAGPLGVLGGAALGLLL